MWGSRNGKKVNKEQKLEAVNRVIIEREVLCSA